VGRHVFHCLREFSACARDVLFEGGGGLWETKEVMTCKSVSSEKSEESGLDVTGYVMLEYGISPAEAGGGGRWCTRPSGGSEEGGFVHEGSTGGLAGGSPVALFPGWDHKACQEACGGLPLVVNGVELLYFPQRSVSNSVPCQVPCPLEAHQCMVTPGPQETEGEINGEIGVRSKY